MRINLDKIKEQIDIIELVKGYTTVEKVNGREYKCKCLNPNHRDKTPSMFINQEKGLFNCFSCGVSGDIISLIELVEGIDFKKAVKKLMDSNNIEYDEVSVTEYVIRDSFNLVKLREMLSMYKNDNYFSEDLKEKYQGVPSYFINLGFKKETLEKFEVGYCGDSNDDMYKRATIVWRDLQGNIAAINGRDTTENKEKKYKFKKGSHKKNIIYNLVNLEKNNKPIIIVESEKDVWTLYEAGYERAVALAGLSLKERKWLLRRYTTSAIIALDNDVRGMEGRKNITTELYPIMDVYAISIPEGKDVSDMSKEEIDYAFDNRVKYGGA